MARHVMIRTPEGAATVVPETALPTEKSLHDVLTEHPALLPAEDLNLGRLVVVGRESNLESGYPDLVTVDAAGDLCIVEVKKEGNSDTRRVVAQLLDYAAALWQLTVAEFEQAVFLPYRQTLPDPDDTPAEIGEFVQQHLQQSSPDAADEASVPGPEQFRERLEGTLADGRFRLVVAAPSIPPGVEKVIEYLNAQGHLMYGLEVSFFSGVADCFVPRLVVRPRVSDTRKPGAASPPLDEADLLADLPGLVRPLVEQFLTAVRDAEGQVGWTSFGASIRPQRSAARVIAFLQKRVAGITVEAPKTYPVEPFEVAREAISAIGIGAVGSDGWQHSVRYDDASEQQLKDYFAIALALLKRLAPNVAFHMLDAPIKSTFTRNDNIIWAKAMPGLAPYVGRWLRGHLSLVENDEEGAPITLEPLAGNQPGWLPRFADLHGGQIWPTGNLTGDYRLEISEVGNG